MANRDYKDSAPGAYFHIYNRGNRKEDIFLEESDFRFFILRLRQYLFPDLKDKARLNLLPKDSFSLICYCLMPNHFHLILRQNSDIPTSKLLLRVCTSYSRYFNKKYDKVGHIFQDQFKQLMIGNDNYLKWLSCYIHQNPKVAGIVKSLEHYRWSSYNNFIGKEVSNICDKEIILSYFKNNKDFKDFTESSYKIISNKVEGIGLTLD
jgi:REP element-mobilizing transposase RayT